MKNLIISEVLLFFSLLVFAEEAVTFSRYETEHQILYFSSNLDPSVIDRLIADAERSEEFINAFDQPFAVSVSLSYTTAIFFFGTQP